jgi:molecular chaperone DnaK
MSLSLVGAGGEALLTLPMAMYRGGDARQGGSALSNPTVLAKDIYLEVVRAGKVERQLLLEKGVNLPVEAQFRFYTADQSGMVLLKLLQGWRLIRTLHLDVPKELPLRSPVELRLKVDDTMLMSAEGEVGGQAFWARIEAPPARDDRSWGEVEQLLADSEQVGRALWGYEAESFRERAQGLRAGIREASATDPDKLQVLVGRLEDLMRDFRSGDKQLTPSYDRFERILNSVRRNVFQDEQRKPLGLSFDAWERRLAELEAKGSDAYQKMDQTAWGRAYSQAQALYESLIQDTLSYTDPTSPEGLLQNLLSFQARVRRLREEVASFVLSDNEETRKVQQDERAALLEGLDREAAGVEGLDMSKGAESRVRLERAHGAVQRLEQRFERLPSLGLVSG